MKKVNNYKTKQKEKVLNTILLQKKEFTIKDIYDEVKDEVGLTTIYRLINKLLDENKLRKYINKDNITYYEYLGKCDKENHFYLKCSNCKRIIHIDCECIDYLSDHIFKNHKFKLNKDNIIINGICNKCLKLEE